MGHIGAFDTHKLRVALVAETGFHAVSIESVARRAGITRPIVYRHFDDLAALLEALVERETVRALGQLQEFVPRDLSGDQREGLMAALGGYLRAVESDPVTPRAPCRRWPTRRRGCCFPTPRAIPPPACSTTRAGCSSRLLDNRV